LDVQLPGCNCPICPSLQLGLGSAVACITPDPCQATSSAMCTRTHASASGQPRTTWQYLAHTRQRTHTHTHPHMMHCIRHFSSHEATTHSTHNNIFVICNMRACGHPTQHYTTKQITLRTMKIDGAHQQVIDIGVVKECQPQYGVIWWQIRLMYFIYIIDIYIYIYPDCSWSAPAYPMYLSPKCLEP